jgi:hypothetical protein
MARELGSFWFFLKERIYCEEGEISIERADLCTQGTEVRCIATEILS